MNFFISVPFNSLLIRYHAKILHIAVYLTLLVELAFYGLGSSPKVSMLSHLLMILVGATKTVLRQCARLSFGIVGTIANATGQLANIWLPQSKAIMTSANTKYKKSFDLPPYTVVESTKDEYEVRQYQEAHWVSTTSSGSRKSTFCYFHVGSRSITEFIHHIYHSVMHFFLMRY